jgi:peptidoglycan/LPS O-acetylase OafA/YrhL
MTTIVQARRDAPVETNAAPSRIGGAHGARTHRFHLLDGLRGFAAILVVLYHMPPYLRQWFACPNAFLAVDFFFCLSGFIIAYSYESRILSGMSIGDFCSSRLIRLYPLYFLGSVLGLLSVCILTHGPGRSHLRLGDLLVASVLSLLVLPNLGTAWNNHSIFPFNGPAWSLFFELFANLIFWFGIRFRFANRLALLLITTTCLILLALVTNPLSDIGAFTQSFTPGFARVGFSFGMGLITFRVYKSGRSSLLSGKIASAGAIAVVALLGGMLLTRGRILEQLTTQLFLVAIVSPLIVYFGALVRVPAAAEPVCSFLGDFSYPVYILHQPFLLVWGGHTAHRLSAVHPVATQLSIPVFCFAVAGISWSVGAFYDIPIRTRLARLRQSQRAGMGKPK